MSARSQKVSLVDRAIIGALLFFASLLIGIQLAKAAEAPPPEVVASPTPVIAS